MPLSPIVIIYGPDGKPIPGPVDVPDRETAGLTGCHSEEFSHNIYTILKDYGYALVYGVDFVREHEPMRIVKQLDKMSVPLMCYFKSGTFLKKAEVRWYRYNEKQGKTEEYFRMTLEHIRLHSIVYKMPHVKDAAFERYGHLEELQLYQKITWHYLKGNLTYTDIWEGAYGELDTKGFSLKKNLDDDADFITIAETLKLTFTSGTFIPPEEGFLFDKEASVKFTLTANRPMEMKDRKLYAKLYAIYKGKTENMGITQEGRPREKENFWIAEFTLCKPQAYLNDKDRAADATVGYYAVIDCVYATNNNYRSDTVTLPMGKELNITFADEEENVFSDASFNLKTNDNVGIANGSITLPEDPGRLDIIFPMAMNYQPGSMPTNA